MYNPFIFKLDQGNSDILEKSSDTNIILSSTINLPLISFASHTFQNRTKSAMSITNNLQTKNNFYYVVNPFEDQIANYEDSLNNLTKYYLNIKDDKPEILSRSFYKMWEILFLFNIADKKEMTFAAIAEGPGPFIQAVILFREKLKNGISNDKIFGIQVHSEKGKYLEMGKQFLGFYNDNHPGLITLQQTVNPSKSNKFKAKSTGDITDIKTISLFKKNIEKTKQYADLVTADGEFEWDDINFQEQEGYKLILGEMVAALNVQAKDGHFVLKIFESFTLPTIKLLYLISSFYNETYIYKPFFSRPSDSERYLICKGFKYDTSQISKEIKMLEETLNKCNTVTNKSLFIVDMFSKLNISQEHLNIFKYININIANTQQIMINNLVVYIKSNNYFGDMYHSYRDKQISANKWWIENFLTDKYNDQSTLIKDTIKYNESELKLFEKNIII